MMRIIPAIDIIDGKCVRLSQGAYESKKVYNENPLEVAKIFENSGLKYLHLVDLDGAKAKHVVNHKILNQIANSTKLLVDFGGGVKSDEDIKIVFENGANQVTIGSIAVSEPEKFEDWLNRFGAEKIILGADVRDGRIAIAGWQKLSEINLSSFLSNYEKKGVKYVLCTDISKDGMLQGTSLNLYQELRKNFPGLKLIASGGVTHESELIELNELGMDGAIIGKAIYEGNISIERLNTLLKID
jgi:phosphoribosylformimino-5-aminoimidazole carboxamide ribotide isomerase